MRMVVLFPREEASRRHLKQSPEPPQRDPVHVEEQQLYCKLLLGDPAPPQSRRVIPLCQGLIQLLDYRHYPPLLYAGIDISRKGKE